MKIAVTGGTGFIGRYILQALVKSNHEVRAWKRKSSDLSGLESLGITWTLGDLTDDSSIKQLVADCDAVVHSALWKTGPSFRGGEGPVAKFAEVNIVGTLKLITQAMEAGVSRFVFLSTCAVHEIILEDRALDEAHPCWATSHYGAHKAAIEKFVHSFAFGNGFDICALRPTGVYGLAHPARKSKWFELVNQVVLNQDVEVSGGGKEVHVQDVAKATEILLHAENVAGQAFNCYDQYISRHKVAMLSREIAGSNSKVLGESAAAKHQIETGKLRDLGMEFGGDELLKETIVDLVRRCQT